MLQGAIDLFHEIQGVAVRQVHVGENQQGFQFAPQELPSLLQRSGKSHFPTLLAVMAGQFLAQQGFILDDQ